MNSTQKYTLDWFYTEYKRLPDEQWLVDNQLVRSLLEANMLLREYRKEPMLEGLENVETSTELQATMGPTGQQTAEPEAQPIKKKPGWPKGKKRLHQDNARIARNGQGATGAGDKTVSNAGVEQLTGFKALVLMFVDQLQSLALVVGSVADLGLNILFYISIGYDLPSKICLAGWGVVTVGAKLWGWSTNRRVLAVWCAVISCFASVAIFMAVLEAQDTASKMVNQTTSIEQRIDGQIEAKENDLKAMRTRRDSLPEDWTTTYNQLTKSLQDGEKELARLMAEKEKPRHQDNQSIEFKMSAWSIFEQMVGLFEKPEPKKVLAFGLALLVAILMELVIAYTTPRKGKTV